MIMNRTKVVDEDSIRRSVLRLAHEVVEKFKGAEEVVLVGIRKRGDHLAMRLARAIDEIEGKKIDVGVLDITLYRDDLRGRLDHPELKSTEILFNINGKILVLVDDVLFTGRTIRAALDALADIGRPSTIQLLVLLDRGHRELPIRADFVGKNLPTSINQQVEVHLKEVDGEDAVYLVDLEDSQYGISQA